MGAWIEILDRVFVFSMLWVAPFMGAWIEMVCSRLGTG